MVDDPHEAETLRECGACGGHFKIITPGGGATLCRWCDGGMMTAVQFATWQKHRSGPHKLNLPPEAKRKSDPDD